MWFSESSLKNTKRASKSLSSHSPKHLYKIRSMKFSLKTFFCILILISSWKSFIFTKNIGALSRVNLIERFTNSFERLIIWKIRECAFRVTQPHQQKNLAALLKAQYQDVLAMKEAIFSGKSKILKKKNDENFSYSCFFFITMKS